jgi:Na+-driven multidrug efflux pump
MVFSGLLRARGDARRAMYVTLAGAVTTAILDPILIFGFDLGVDGAAIASVVSRIVLLFVGYQGAVRRHHLVGRPNLAHMRTDLRAILGIAVPAILTQLATPVGNAYITASIAAFGDPAVAAWAIIWRLIPVAFGAIFALSGSIGPILGQNLGAGAHDRLRRALLDSLIFATLYVATVWFVLFLVQDQIARLFGTSGETEALVRFFCTWIAGSFLFWGALFVANAAFNNLGFPALATLFNWGRATIGTIPFVAVGAALWGAEGVLIGQGLGSVLFGISSVATCFYVISHIGRPPRTGRPLPLRWFALPPFTSGKGGTAG